MNHKIFSIIKKSITDSDINVDILTLCCSKNIKVSSLARYVRDRINKMYRNSITYTMRRSQSAQMFCPGGKGLLLGGAVTGAVTCFVTICCGGCGG